MPLGSNHASLVVEGDWSKKPSCDGSMRAGTGCAQPRCYAISNGQSDRGTLVVNDCRYSTSTLAAAIIASAMIEPRMKQITSRLNELTRMLDGDVDVSERRELLKQFRYLLDQADKLNVEASSVQKSQGMPG